MSTILTITYFGYSGNYVRKHASWGFNNNFTPFTDSIIGAKDQAKYLNNLGDQVSQTDFQGRFDKFITGNTLANIRNILEYHNYYFPATKAVQTGSANTRLNEELRLTFNRLQNNTELNLVKKQIQDYIDAAAAGLLIDNRPKQ